MDLKGEVRVRKKPKKDSFVFATILTTVLLIGGLFFPKEISFFLKEKIDFSKILNPTVAPPTITFNDKRQSIVIVDRGEKGDTPIEVLMNEASRSLMLGHYDIAASTVERAMRISPNNGNLIYTLADIRLKQGKAELTEALAMKVISLSKADPFLKRRSWLLIAQSRRLKGEVSDSEQAEVTALRSKRDDEKNKLNAIIKQRLDEERKTATRLKEFQEKLLRVKSALVELEKKKAMALNKVANYQLAQKNTESNFIGQEWLASNKEIKKIKDEQIKEKNKLIVLHKKRKRLKEKAQIESQLLRSKIKREKEVLAALDKKTKQVQKKTIVKKVPNSSKQFIKDSYIEFFPNGLKQTEFRVVSNNKFIKMEWYKNGNQHTFKEYLNGKRNGVWKVWDKSGRLLEISTYYRGNLITMLRPQQSR